MEATCSRNHGRRTMEEESERGVMIRRHQGGTRQAPKQEAPRRHPGGTQGDPGTPSRHTGGTQEALHPEAPRKAP